MRLFRAIGGGGRKRSLNTAIPSLTNTFEGKTKEDKNSSSCVSIDRLVIDDRDFVSALDSGVSSLETFEESVGDACSNIMLEVCIRSSLLFTSLLLVSDSTVSLAMGIDFAVDGGRSVFALSGMVSEGWLGGGALFWGT